MRARLIVDAGFLLYIGPIDSVPMHACPANVLAFGLDRAFQWATFERESKTGKAVARTASVRMAFSQSGALRSVRCDAPARVAVTLVDPALPLTPPASPSDAMSVLHQLWSTFTPDAWCRYRVTLGCAGLPSATDARVRNVLGRMASDPSVVESRAALSSSVGLSPSRLDHLFKSQVGLPIRRYRQWLRFGAMARFMAQGSTVTGAAHDAGFFDSAHFGHAFKQSFGTTPSFVFQPGLAINVVPLPT